jgi:hypothetical protein
MEEGFMVRRCDTHWFMGDDRFIELMHALTHPEERWAQPERPDILLALDELIVWVNDTRNYDERVHESGWMSAVKDFLAATDSLGSKTKQIIQSHVDAIRSSCQRGVGGNQSLRTQLSNEAAAMRQTLTTAPTLHAAWIDLLRILSRAESSMNTAAARRDNFWAIVRATDRNTIELSRRLTSVLTGDPFEALKARLELGEIDRIDGSIQSIRSSTPLINPRQRLDLAIKVLISEPASRTHIVWFAFRNAGLTSMGQSFGSIRLFDARWLRAILEQDGPSRDEIPSELRGLEDPSTIPDQRDVVMASVNLGPGTFSDAVRVASERIDAFLGMSTIGCPIAWEQMHGFIHVQDGHIVTHQYFVYEDDRLESPLALDGTAAQIAKMAPRVAPKLPVNDHDLKDIIDALHWWRGGLDQPTAASIVVNVRIIELVASRIGETFWTTYLEKYMKNSWIQNAILDMLDIALREALTRHVSAGVQARQREIFLKAMQYSEGQQRFMAARYLDAIIEFTAPNLPLGRELRTIKQRTSSTVAIQAWCTELERLWQAWVHRLERVRNSIAHGGPFTEQAVLITQPFSQKVAVWALWESIEGFLEGKTLTQSHIDLKSQWDQWRSSLQNATSIDDIFIHA